MADTLASFGRRLDGFQKQLTDEALGHALGKMAKSEAKVAASADLGGDPKFSGWKATLDTRYDIVGRGKVLLKPTRRSAGPWTVANDGRNQGDAGIGPMQGPTLTKTGRVSRARRKRWNGQTQGKGTADDALAAIKKKAPGVVDAEVGRALRKAFG